MTQRQTVNPEKVIIDKAPFRGFYLEAFYYKNKPDVVYIGTGDKIAVLQDYEIKALMRLSMKVGNYTHLMGGNCDKIMREKFRKLMEEKNNDEKNKE